MVFFLSTLCICEIFCYECFLFLLSIDFDGLSYFFILFDWLILR